MDVFFFFFFCIFFLKQVKNFGKIFYLGMGFFSVP